MSKITISGSTERVFTHDAAGNIATDTRSGALYAYDYNARNRLETVTVASTLRGTYTYNGLEQLAIRVLTNMSPSGTTHFIHDRRGNLGTSPRAGVIAETGGSGPSSTDREYIWLPEAEIAPVFNSRAQIDRPLAVVDQVSTSTQLARRLLQAQTSVWVAIMAL